MIVSKDDITKALQEIDRVGIYKKNRSKKFCLEVDKHHYPPKEVLRLAYFIRTGERLSKLHGGPQTNNPLLEAGFTIRPDCPCRNITCKII